MNTRPPTDIQAFRLPGPSLNEASRVAPDADAGGKPSAIVDRCVSLGLPTWRSSLTGDATLANLGEPPEVQAFLQAPSLLAMLRESAAQWAGSNGVRVSPLWPDCWVIGVPEITAGQPTGWTLALAASPIALVSPTFEKICQEAATSEDECRRLLLGRANHDRRTVRMLAASMGWMAQDLARVADDHATIETFAHQITDGLDAMDLLQGAGRSMRVQLRPRDFVQRTCDRLFGYGGFGQLVVWMASARAPVDTTARSLPSLQLQTSAKWPGEIVSAGPLTIGRDHLDEAVAKLILSVAPGDRPLITTGVLDVATGGVTVVLPISRGDRLIGLLLAQRSSAQDAMRTQHMMMLDSAVQSIATILENAELYADQQRLLLGTLGALTATIDAKDRYTCGHSERVAYLARQLALAAGLPASTAERLYICGLVHDIGKIGIPESILTKPAKLTEAEYAIVKTHPDVGYSILRQMPMLSDVLPGIRHHHERWDGNGYPSRLEGPDIPLFGRVIAVADTFDAMSSDRSYRSSRSRTEVLAELRRVSGTQLDPSLIPAMLAIDFTEYDELMRQHKAGVPPIRMAA